jgi:large subunit ribosomal protein L6
MSRYAKIPIPLPKGVEVKQAKEKVAVKGPKGQLELQIPADFKLDVKETELFVQMDEKSEVESSHYGLYRSLINNMVVGVSQGFEKKLQLIGVGYRAAVSGNKLDLQLGFSHPQAVEIPNDLTVTVEKSTLIVIQGMDKQVVGQFAANVRAKRPPEPYKGKGVRYHDEYVRKKAGKAAKGK